MIRWIAVILGSAWTILLCQHLIISLSAGGWNVLSAAWWVTWRESLVLPGLYGTLAFLCFALAVHAAPANRNTPEE